MLQWCFKLPCPAERTCLLQVWFGRGHLEQGLSLSSGWHLIILFYNTPRTFSVIVYAFVYTNHCYIQTFALLIDKVLIASSGKSIPILTNNYEVETFYDLF